MGYYYPQPAMTSRSLIFATHRTILEYYENLRALEEQNEMNVRSAFEFLLEETAKRKSWTLVLELSGKVGGNRECRVVLVR